METGVNVELPATQEDRKRTLSEYYNERMIGIYNKHSVRMAITRKTKDTKCWRGCGEKGTLVLVEMETDAAIMQSSMEMPQKL